MTYLHSGLALVVVVAVAATSAVDNSMYSFGKPVDRGSQGNAGNSMYGFGGRSKNQNAYGFGTPSSGRVNGYEASQMGFLAMDPSIKNALIYRDGMAGNTDVASLKLSSKPSNELRGIYVDFIYDPNFYLELSVVKYMLEDILDRNNNTPFYYDYERSPNAYRVTVGVENLILLDESIVSIKPKLLKDILYNENIFLRIYDFLYAFFQVTVRDSSRIPEYDRAINFKAYTDIFKDTLKVVDSESKTVCRKDELYGVYDGRLCVRADLAYIENAKFTRPETRHYWKTILPRIAEFMNVLLTNTIRVDANSNHDDCYEIMLRPELDVRAVLLFPHRAVKSALVHEKLVFSQANRNRIIDDIILFKHRVMHALGVGHKYVTPSIMTFYNKPWQNENLFYIMPEDYDSLSQCYVDPRSWTVPSAYRTRLPRNQLNKRYVKTHARDAMSLLNMFINNFDRFISVYRSVQ